jgi:hypothetical protein
MKKILLLLVVYLFFNSLLLSQWSKEYGNDEVTNLVTDIIAVEDGYYISAGHSFRLWLLKTDLNGDTLWTKKYNDIGYSKIIDTKTTGLFLLNENYANHKLKIVKLDYSGNINWERNFSSLKDYSYTNDNSFLILNTQNANVLKLLNLNEFGDTAWTKYYTFPRVYNEQVDLFNFNDNGSIITVFDYNYNFDAVKLDNNGDSLWTTKLDSVYNRSLYVNQNNKGDYYFAGNSNRESYGLEGKSYLVNLDNEGNHLTTEFMEDEYWAQFIRYDSSICKVLRNEHKIILTDQNHNLIWEKDYSGLFNMAFFPTPKLVTSFNDLIFYGYDLDLGSFLLKMTSDGEFIWQNYFTKDSLNLMRSDIISLSEDDYILTSNTLESQSKETNFKLINFQTPNKLELIIYPQLYYNPNTNKNETVFHDSIDVRIVSNVFDADIYYTLDGSEPNQQSNLYTKPFRLDSNATVKVSGISSQYENSDVLEKVYEFYQKFTVEMADLYVGIDSNFVGKSNVNIEIPIPIAPLGEVSSLKWILSNSVIGEGNILSYQFGSGTNELILETTGSWGSIQYDTTIVTVYSAKRKRDIESNEFALNKRITPASQLDNGNILLSTKFDEDRYSSAQPAILDSLLNFKWIGTPYRYLLSTPCVIDDKNILFAFDSGILLHFEDSSSTNFYIKDNYRINEKVMTSPSYSSDSLLFIGTLDGKVVSIHLSNFKEVLWEYECGDSILSDIVFDAQNHLIFGCNDNYLYSLDIEGNLNWKFDVGDDVESTAAIGLDSSIVFGADNGYLYKLNNNGEEIWNYKTDGAIKSSPVIDYNGNIYFGSADGNLYSLSPNGNLNWKFYTDANKEPFASLGNNGLVYVNDGLNMMYVLDISGNIKWYFKLAQEKIAGDNFQDLYEEIFGVPMVTDNNLIFLRTTFGQFYMFKDDYKSDLDESLVPQWATFKGSNKRTGNRISDFPSTINNSTINELVKTFELKQNYPNPFNPTTKIKYMLAEKSKVNIKVFDILGKEIVELVNEVKDFGSNETIFDASNLPSGVYFYRIRTENFIDTKKMILLR